MKRVPIPRLTPSLVRGSIATWQCVAFLSAVALSGSPHWHELLHLDANAAQHECAVTLISAGNYQHTTPAPLVLAPAPAVQFSFVLALHPIWVASPFLGASIFEHAPPTVG